MRGLNSATSSDRSGVTSNGSEPQVSTQGHRGLMPRYGAAIDRHPTFRLIGRHIVGLSIIVLVTLVYGHGGLIGTFINPLTVGFVLLLAILCASTLWGLSVAMLMSFAATLMYDFFVLPPVGTFNISDRRN